MKRAFLLILFSAFYVFSLMAYESPITAPGAGGVEDMYTTAGNGPHRVGENPNNNGEQTYNPEDWTGGLGKDGGYGSNDSPIGAPFILLAFAAAYAGVRLAKKKE